MSEHPDDDQYNSIHEKLIAQWGRVAATYGLDKLHFSCFKESVEDSFTVEYLMDTASQAGLAVKMLDVQEIGIGELGNSLVFTDMQDEPINAMFKLYPWEHMLREEFAQYIMRTDTKWIEPAWKAVISNKAMMAYLWEKFPNHPNLIESYFLDEVKNVREGFVAKPFFSREGAGIVIPGVDATDEEEEHGGYIEQKYTPLTKFGDSYPVIGSWVVGDEACGIGIREDDSLITKNTSRFIPHIIKD
jgi:glutathionylspermidine synthase